MFEHFRKLLDAFQEVQEEASLIVSANPEGDRMIANAVVGYSYFRPTEHWSRTELEFVNDRRNEVELLGLGSHWTEFVCLASGYLLGMYQAGQCNDAEFALFEAQLPGFMWLHAKQFTGEAKR